MRKETDKSARVRQSSKRHGYIYPMRRKNPGAVNPITGWPDIAMRSSASGIEQVRLQMRGRRIRHVMTAAMLLLFSLGLHAQDRTVDVSKARIGELNCKNLKTIYASGDTLPFVWIGFQNADYEHIVDIRSVIFSSQAQIDTLISDLQMAAQEKRSTVHWYRESYTMKVYDFTSNIYLYEAAAYGSGHTEITKKQAEKLVEWLGKVRLP